MEAIRTVDELGRVTLPKTVREYLGIFEGDKLEIIIQGGNIILARHTQSCFACDDDTNVQKVNRTYLCEECREAVSKTLAEAS